MRLTVNCKFCEVATRSEIVSESRIGPYTYYRFKCGHAQMETTPVESEDSLRLTSIAGDKEAYEFQKIGILFAQKTDYNCLIADAMGLGKTIQALLCIANENKLSPTLVVIKAATLYQWMREYKSWASESDLGIMAITSSKAPILPGLFSTYLISMELLARKGMVEKLLPLKVKSVVVDESHSFKDPDAKRSRALVQLIKELDIQHKIFLSGTPVKNRASEYFTVLNLLAPAHFPSYAQFCRKWLDDNGRIRPYLLEEFHTLISRWVIRREKREVLTNLPPFRRTQYYITIDDPVLKDSYNRELDLFSNFERSGGAIDQASLLGWLQRLRHITGKAKITHALEYIHEFLNSADGEKIAIGIHHQDVRDGIYYALQEQGLMPLKLSGEDSAEVKDRIIQEFTNNPARRILILNMLAGGVGLNIQCCAHTVILERQWNAADEEQYESRFDRNGQTKSVLAEYMLASGTIDQFFTEMVESKRKMMGETLSTWAFTSDKEAMRELADRVRMARL